MSRLWAERLRIGLAPDRVDLARMRRFGGRRVVAQTSVACRSESAQAPWDAALNALDSALPGIAGRRDSVAVVLSNAFVRYLVIPWQPEVSSARELSELVSLRFKHTFGEAADDWTIRCSRAGYGEPSVACAVDTALVTALRERLGAHQLKLASVQPLLMAAHNDHRRKLAATSAFATVERGRLALSLMQNGHWSHVVSRRAGADPVDAVEQELATFASATAPAHVDVLLVGEGTWWPEDAMLPSRLLGGSAAGGGASLALCGTA